MARQSLVLDASVGVKWFSARDEASLEQALAIRDAHVEKEVLILVPDLFFYEVANAVAGKKSIPSEVVRSAVASMFDLDLGTVAIDSGLLDISVTLSRQLNVTVYDAVYIALSVKYDCPLVTANPRQQKEGSECAVIPVEDWHRKRV